MRITLKALANLLAVALVGLVAVGWAIVGLTHVNPFQHPKTMRVQLAASGGALPGAEVTYLGVPIGKVTSARLIDNAVELRLSITPRGPMGRDLRATVRQKDALGEPYVDLAPVRDGEPAGDPDGTVIPIARTAVPVTLDTLLTQANALVSGLDPSDLAALTQAMSGLAGHAQDLRTVLAAGADLGGVLAKREAELGSLLAASAQLTSALDADRAAFGSALSGGARLSAVLAARTSELVDILANGGEVGVDGSSILTATSTAIPGVLAGLDTTAHTLADRPVKVQEIMQLTPQYVMDLSRTFHDGASWSSVGGLPTLPYEPTYALPIEGKGMRIDRLFLPTIAQRLEFDMGSSSPSVALLALSPTQLRQLQQGVSPEALAAAIEQQAAAVTAPGPAAPSAGGPG